MSSTQVRSEIEADEFEDDADEEEEVRDRTYRFRMRHVFYIHLAVFVAIGLLGGLVVYLVENYSSSRNQHMPVSYVNAWFLSCTCAYGCGLTTVNFAQLSKASQIILLLITLFSGFTVSTLPVLAIKAYTHKDARSSGSETESQLALLPSETQIRYWAYLIIIALTVATCASVYLCYFIILGAWLDIRYSASDLAEGNSTVHPWYASIVIVVTGFNQNGLAPFSDGMARFVNDVYVNIFVMMVILSGASLFPFLLRNVVLLAQRLSPWRYKIVFDYILLNHHHLSTLLFPTLQTRIYLFVTGLLYVVTISISLILDLHNPYLAQFASGTRFLIFLFQSVSARFAGFQTIDISHLATATLLVYLILMGTKPQMLYDEPVASQSHMRLFLLRFAQTIFKHTRQTLGRTRTWLFIFIFLICAIERDRMAVDPELTFFKILFEIVSAFGCVGLSLGYPGVSSSFSTVLSPVSRVLVGLTMLLGRHRGLLASMKDQEEIELTASALLDKWKEQAMRQPMVTMRF